MGEVIHNSPDRPPERPVNIKRVLSEDGKRELRLDLSKPYVVKIGRGKGWGRGDILYPSAFSDGKKAPGDHSNPKYIALSPDPDNGVYGLQGFKKRDVILLDDLVARFGKKADNVTIESSESIDRLLDALAESEVPEGIRNREELSQITSAESKTARGGIVFDTPEELYDALRVYAGGLILKGQERTTAEDVDQAREEHGYTGGLIVEKFLAQRDDVSGDICEHEIQEIAKNFSKEWGYVKSFDHWAMGTKFAGVDLTAKIVNEKYVLEIYRGQDEQTLDHLARILQKERAVVNQRLTYTLSPVGNTGWVGVDLEKALKEVVEKEEIFELIRDAAYSDSIDGVPVSVEGSQVCLRVRIEQMDNYYPRIVGVNGRLFLELSENKGKIDPALVSIRISSADLRDAVDDKTKNAIDVASKKIDAIIKRELLGV